jgi:hypothetical protein
MGGFSGVCYSIADVQSHTGNPRQLLTSKNIPHRCIGIFAVANP